MLARYYYYGSLKTLMYIFPLVADITHATTYNNILRENILKS